MQWNRRHDHRRCRLIVLDVRSVQLNGLSPLNETYAAILSVCPHRVIDAVAHWHHQLFYFHRESSFSHEQNHAVPTHQVQTEAKPEGHHHELLFPLEKAPCHWRIDHSSNRVHTKKLAQTSEIRVLHHEQSRIRYGHRTVEPQSMLNRLNGSDAQLESCLCIRIR